MQSEKSSGTEGQTSMKYIKIRPALPIEPTSRQRVSSPTITHATIRAGFESYLTSLVDQISQLLAFCLSPQMDHRVLTEHEQLVRIRQTLLRLDKIVVKPLARTPEFQDFKKQADAKRMGRLINGEERSTSASRIAEEYLIANLGSGHSGKGSFSAVSSSLEGKHLGI